MATRQILEISTLIPDRLGINIDGRVYEMRDSEEMGVVDLVRLQALYKEALEIQALPEEAITEEVGVNLSHVMDKFCRLLLNDCPDDVHRKLKDHHRMAIFEVFQQAAGDKTPQPQNRQQRRTQKKQTTAK